MTKSKNSNSWLLEEDRTKMTLKRMTELYKRSKKTKQKIPTIDDINKLNSMKDVRKLMQLFKFVTDRVIDGPRADEDIPWYRDNIIKVLKNYKLF